ncbi:hypothetical protein [Hyunsoonleella ulvae]|uniref:hypothetical protein n=1 Tax=Hyunsoonleella ulvae TaxID=2799948 RepID=UPI001939F321|nr:hypothetical protein [Hyunsoonleella ulvae]
MENQLITFFLTVVTAVISAIITYVVSIRTSLRSKEIEIRKEQEFKYFFPLKFSADELYHRLAHIEKKIFEKKDINIQLPQTIEGKSLEWYFLDWENPEKPEIGAGGYFLITTIFMHAQLYNRINQLLKVYPFLKVRLRTTLRNKIENNKNELTRCLEDVINDEHTVGWTKVSDVMNLSGEIPIEELIKFIRLSAVMKGGIPYGLQTAFGEFLEKNDSKENSQINYEDFARILMDKENRVKFLPLINFYTGLVDDQFSVDSSKLTKIRALMLSLLMFRDAELI